MAVSIAQASQVTCFTQACEVAVNVTQAGDGQVYVVTEASKVDTAVVRGLKGVVDVVQTGEVTVADRPVKWL